MYNPRINWQLIEATRYVSIWFDESLSLFIHQWSNHNQTMGVNFEIFIENAQVVAKYQVMLQPKTVIIDATGLNITFGSEINNGRDCI
ncbi:hypothetical protein [Microscilla marina]|uniref:Uncharacterized protein n=1 Tax=Microscilla marina ATCC 23134 TaxID=313606 RepID=A1ZJL0_MICM2|nr:hypothetical protein [Microscilla marina]EAY29313.1 hypothetical protein M23134_01367 [Microscilla marina ATCC 23134]